MADDNLIPEVEGDSREAGRRLRFILKYLNTAAFLRVEPNKYTIEAIARGEVDHRGMPRRREQS